MKFNIILSSFVFYSSLNLPDGTVQGPLSLRGLPTTVKCKNSLTCLGTLHHQGSITGLKTDLGSLLGKGAKHPTKKQTNKVKSTSFVCILRAMLELDLSSERATMNSPC